MRIGIKTEITKKSTGEIILNYSNILSISSLQDLGKYEVELENMYSDMLRTQQDSRERVFSEKLADPNYAGLAEALDSVRSSLEDNKPDGKRGLENLMNFFSEFQFDTNFRFVNTLLLHLNMASGEKKAKEYIHNYFALTDSPYSKEIDAKMKSDEFKMILRDLKDLKTTKKINDRFKLYFGSQGSGKTYTAQQETEGRCVICNSGILPNDLMEDFAFNDGKPAFNGSMLKKCMTEGLTLVLDEINLLPYETLRYLQGLLDGKTEFDYKSETIHIKEGFKIIGTMNLSINGMTYGLPEPLVDRCETMKQFKLTADDLLKAI